MDNNSKKINKLTQLSLFLAIGIILNLVEAMIPLPISIPGVKLGLANTIGLVLLYYYSEKEYLLIGLARVIFVGLLRTGLFSMTFVISLGGWFLSSLIVILLYKFKTFSIFGLSIASAVFHGIGQIFVVMIYYNTTGIVLYLPILMLTGVITGLLTSGITALVLSKVNPHIKHITHN